MRAYHAAGKVEALEAFGKIASVRHVYDLNLNGRAGPDLKRDRTDVLYFVCRAGGDPFPVARHAKQIVVRGQGAQCLRKLVYDVCKPVFLAPHEKVEDVPPFA